MNLPGGIEGIEGVQPEVNQASHQFEMTDDRRLHCPLDHLYFLQRGGEETGALPLPILVGAANEPGGC